MPAQRLNQRAWFLGESPDQWPRSRYSGVALRPGQMTVTVIVSWSELFGHSYIAFELGGGKNCARWVVEVAAVAGIDVQHWLSSVVAVPKRLVRCEEPIRDEGRMWQRRHSSRAHHRT